MPIYEGVLVFPSAKNAGWHDLSIINAGMPTEYATKAWEVWFVSREVNSPLSNKTPTKSSEKLIKAKAVGIEKKSPIFRDIIKLFEKFFLFFLRILLTMRLIEQSPMLYQWYPMVTEQFYLQNTEKI